MVHKFKAIFTKIWTPIRLHGEGFGFIFLFIGLVTLLIIKLVTDSPAFSDIIGIILGLLSVWLGFTAVGMSAKSDLQYAQTIARVDPSIIKLSNSYDIKHDKVEHPTGNIL